MKNESELIAEARLVEAATWYPDGREFDGAPYQCNDYLYPDLLLFMGTAFQFLGGEQRHGYLMVKDMIRERQKTEELADPFCGNWMLWTVLNALGVSRVDK
jgi:hypothetical protein